MFEFDDNLMYSVGVFLIISYALYQYKHPKMFDEKGNFRCFGLQKHETVFPFWLVTTVFGLLVYTYFVTKDAKFV